MLVVDSSFPARGFNERNAEPVQQVVLHYTAAPFASSLRTLTQDGVSAHYLLPDPDDPGYRATGHDELRVFRLVDEDKRAWHAGVVIGVGGMISIAGRLVSRLLTWRGMRGACLRFQRMAKNRLMC
jgi:N-acetyl-anhydromuramyl-L-alanine amidase AmpD